MVDDSIIRLLEHVLSLKPTHGSYDKFPSVAHSILSKPYPIMARQMLGYLSPDLLCEDERDIEFIGMSPGNGSSNNYDMPAATQP
jgi:hypothetical protein